MPKQQSKQNYLHGAAILTLGAFYKIPLGNILGDEGYAHFMVAYSIFNVFLTLTTAGLPVALSRMISEADTLGKPMQMRRVFRVSLLVFAVVGLISSLIMYLFPTELAVMMDEVEAAQSIWAISPAIFLVCLAAAYRGYAQGQSNMKPTTVSQVLEVLGKVAVGLVLAWYLTRIGKSLPVASGGAIFGVTAGSLLSLIYMMIYKRRHYPTKAVSDPDVPDRSGKIVATLLRIGIPITLGSCVMSLINLIDAKLVLNRLQTAAGVSYFEAKNLYGIYGKAQTLSNLPASFIVPLTISIIPAITALVVRGEHREASRQSAASIRVAALVFMPMGVGLAVLAEPIMRVIYPTGNAAGPLLLSLLGVGAIVMCLHDALPISRADVHRRAAGKPARALAGARHGDRRRGEDPRELHARRQSEDRHLRRADRHARMLRRDVRDERAVSPPAPGRAGARAAGALARGALLPADGRGRLGRLPRPLRRARHLLEGDGTRRGGGRDCGGGGLSRRGGEDPRRDRRRSAPDPARRQAGRVAAHCVRKRAFCPQFADSNPRLNASPGV